MILPIPVQFIVVAEEHQLATVFRTVVQKREDIGVLYENTRVSSLMRSYDIIDRKRQLENTQGKQNKHLLVAYYSSVKYCQSSDTVSATFVEHTNMLHNNALNVSG